MDFEDGDGGSDYGGEYDQEIEQEDKAQEVTQKKKKAKAKDGRDDFASYEEFADLLENEDTTKADKDKQFLTGKRKMPTNFDHAANRFLK
jgi:hypothetical protein